MGTLGKVLSVSVISMLFLGAGFFMGARKAPSTAGVADAGRFKLMTDDRAFDSKTGKTCIIVQPFEGFKLNGPTPACSELAGQ